jgi:hypothetical protein
MKSGKCPKCSLDLVPAVVPPPFQLPAPGQIIKIPFDLDRFILHI